MSWGETLGNPHFHRSPSVSKKVQRKGAQEQMRIPSCFGIFVQVKFVYFHATEL